MIKKAFLVIRERQTGGGITFLMQKVAGVPLIKRTLLSLQKAGIEEVLIANSGNLDVGTKKIIEDDQRIKATIIYADAMENLPDVCKSGQDTLLVTDDVVFNHKKLETLLFDKDNSSEVDSLRVIAKEGICLVPARVSYEMLGYVFSESSFDTILEKYVNAKTCKENDVLLGKITDAISIKKTEKNIFKSIESPTYGFLEKNIDRKVSIFLTKFFIKTDLTPNNITLISTAIGLLSVYFFISGNKAEAILGGTLFVFSTIIDCCDGEVARIKFQESKYGSLLDIICDNLVQIPLFFAIAYGCYQNSHDSQALTVGGIAVIGSLLSFLFIFFNMWGKEDKSKELSANSLSPIEKREYNLGKYLDNMINRDFCYIILVCAMYGVLDWFMIATAIGTNVLWFIIFVKKIGTLIYEKA